MGIGTRMEAVRYLAGRYRLIERLGTGGMSVVWRAYDEILGRPVAVKVLAPSYAADPHSRERIRTEARAAARLSHPYITNVYDYGESTESGGATVPFVVMELVDGHPLDSRLADGPIDVRFAIEVCAQVAAALAAVHARGLVHRDVKPANIMLTPGGAKVVDFGISAVVGAEPEPDATVYGTPAYLAPERLDGGPADAASDVYALGLVLYRATSGRLPWDAETTTQMLTAHCYIEPEPLPHGGDLPDAVIDLCNRCLAKDPTERPRAAEAARVLAGAADVRLAAFAVPVPGSADPRTRRRPGGRRWVRAGAVGVGLAATALVLATCAAPDGRHGPAGGSRAVAEVPPAAPQAGCEVVYATRSDAAGQFQVDLTVTNMGAQPLPDWVLAFDYPGDQRVVGLSGAEPSQDGGRVHLRGSGALAPGGIATLVLTGAYGTGNPMPTAFTLNGQPCTGRLVGATGAASALDSGPGSAAAAGGSGPGSAAGSGAGSSGAGAGSGSGSSGNASGGKDKDKKKKKPK